MQCYVYVHVYYYDSVYVSLIGYEHYESSKNDRLFINAGGRKNIKNFNNNP